MHAKLGGVRLAVGISVLGTFALFVSCAPPVLELVKDRDSGAPDAGNAGAGGASSQGGSAGAGAVLNGGSSGTVGSGGSLSTGGMTPPLGTAGMTVMGGAGSGGSSGGSDTGSTAGTGGTNTGGTSSGGTSAGGASNGGMDAGSDAAPLCLPTDCTPFGATCCGGLCVSTGNDPMHCGNCKTKCTHAEVCTNSVCIPVSCESPRADAGVTCNGNELCCFGKCCDQTHRCCDDGRGGYECRFGEYCLPP